MVTRGRLIIADEHIDDWLECKLPSPIVTEKRNWILVVTPDLVESGRAQHVPKP